MKKLILTFLGIALFAYFLFQIEYEKFYEILNIKNIFLFIFASLLVAITNVVFYYRFKTVNVDLLKKKFLVEFLYYRFLSILSFKDIGEIIAKFFILKNIKKINKSKNIFFITYEKVYDLAIPVLLIIPMFITSKLYLNLVYLCFIFVLFYFRKVVIKFLIDLCNSLFKLKLKFKEIQHLIYYEKNLLYLTVLKIILILVKFSFLLLICNIDFDAQKLFVNYIVFQFLNFISLTPGGIGVFDILAFKSAELIYAQSEMVIIFVLLNRVSNVMGTTVAFIMSKFIR